MHAINILKAVFREACLAVPLQVYTERACIVAVEAFGSHVWVLRNAATQLFSEFCDVICRISSVHVVMIITNPVESDLRVGVSVEITICTNTLLYRYATEPDAGAEEDERELSSRNQRCRTVHSLPTAAALPLASSRHNQGDHAWPDVRTAHALPGAVDSVEAYFRCANGRRQVRDVSEY